MKHEAWEKVCHLLNQEELVWVFRDVLDRNELSSLLRESRLSWLTARIEGASEEDLAERAARAFRTNPHVARSAVETLDGKTIALRERIAHQSGREIHEEMAVSEGMLAEGKVGEIFWGLARDERTEINEGLTALRAGLLHLLRGPRPPGGRKEEPRGHDDEALLKLTGDLAAAREETEEAREKLVKFEALEEEAKDLRHAKEGLVRIRGEQEAELNRLQAEALEASGDANILARIEREVRRLAFTLEKVEAQLGGPSGPPGPLERGLLERLDAWHEDLAVWGQDRGKSEEDMLALLSEVRDRLSALTTPALAEAEVQAPARGGPGGPGERVAVFVDGQSMYFGARKAGGKLDFKRFLEGTVRGRSLVKAVAYLVQGEKDVGGLAGLLRRYGYEVRIKERGPAAAAVKRVGWEMEIAMDILSSLGEVDAVALGSGEEEFAGLAEFLKGRDIRFEVFAFPEAVSPTLKGVADVFYPMGEDMVLRFDRWGWEGAPRGERVGEANDVTPPPGPPGGET